MGIIYKYTNRNTGKHYIGQTIHPEQRKRNHKHEAEVRNSDYYFHRSIRKHGWDAFDYEVLEETNDLSNRESFYIEQYNSVWPNGYNQLAFHNAMTDEIKEKISQTKKLQWNKKTEEEKQSHINEHIERMRQSNLGRKQTDYQKEQAAKANRKNWKITNIHTNEVIFTSNLPETCRQLGVTRKNLYNTCELTKKRIKHHKGYILNQV